MSLTLLLSITPLVRVLLVKLTCVWRVSSSHHGEHAAPGSLLWWSLLCGSTAGQPRGQVISTCMVTRRLLCRPPRLEQYSCTATRKQLPAMSTSGGIRRINFVIR